MPPHVCSRLTAVRASTSAQHGELDAALGGRAVLSTASGYRRLLTVTAAVVDRSAESWDLVSAEVGLDRPSTVLGRALRADLGSIAAVVPAWSKPPAAPISLSYAAGVGYALEGSALGAKTILRRLGQADGIDLPTSYYELLASAASTRWPLFCRWLELADLDDAAVNDGAQDVFATALHAVGTIDQRPVGFEPV